MSDGEDTFKSHLNRTPVCNFIRILLMDSLLNVSANTNTHPLTLLLEVNAHTLYTVQPTMYCNLLVHRSHSNIDIHATHSHYFQSAFPLKKASSIYYNTAKLSFLQKVPLFAQLINKAEPRYCW